MVFEFSGSFFMPHLLHIGMPKCLSGPLQDMFARDQGNFYLGMEPGANVPKQVLYAVETELMQVPSHHYNETVLQNLFHVAIETAKERSSGTLVLREERLLEGYSIGGASVGVRLARFAAVMPKDTTALMVVRNPQDYLKQYYRHLVMTACLPVSYADWVRYLLVRGSKSFLGLLDYASCAGAVAAHFQDVEIVLYEQMLEDGETLHKRLAARGITLGVPLADEDIHDHEEAQVAHMQQLAQEYAGQLGGHPALALDIGDLNTFSDNSPMFESLLLRDAVRQAGAENMREAAAKLARAAPGATLDYSLDSQSERMLAGYVAQVNGKLAEITGLPLAHYGYDLGEAQGAGAGQDA
jgi:hypothetical protein